MRQTPALRIAVTGASGLLGSHFLEALCDENHGVPAGIAYPIVALYATDGSPSRTRLLRDLPQEKIEWRKIDLLDYQALADAFVGIDWVIHCAAKVSFSPNDHEELTSINVLGTENVAEAARANDVKRFGFISSVAALGRKINPEHKGPIYITEGSEWERSKENSAYAQTKRRAEMEVWRAAEEGLPSIVVHPSVILGRGDWDSGSSAIIKRVAKGLPLGMSSDGLINVVDVRDVVEFTLHLMSSETTPEVGEKWILNGHTLPYLNFFGLVAKAFGLTPPTKLLPKWVAKLVAVTSSFSGFFGKQGLLTSETIRTAYSQYHYKADKAKAAGFNPKPIEETLAWLAKAYKQDNPNL